MSYEDLFDDLSAPKLWFEDAVNEESANRIGRLWKKFCEACGDGWYRFDAEGAEEFILDRYPELWSGYEPSKTT